jgi:predicted metal-dependent peptidase
MSANTGPREAVSPSELVSHFRMMSHQFFPYLSPYVYQLVPVERPGIGTMAVDTTGRMYYDPDFVERITLEQGSYVVLHEAMHLILRHCHRKKDIVGDTPTQRELYLINAAYDLVIWEMLEAMAEHAPAPGPGQEPITWHNMSKEYPKLRRNMLPSEIYAIMLEQEEEEEKKGKEPGGEGDGDGEQDGTGGHPGSDGKDGNQGGGGGQKADGPGKWQMIGGGSAADGQRRDYEEDPNPNWDAFIEDQLLDQIEKTIEKHEQGRGTVPGEFKRVIQDKLRPAPNPWDCLRSAVAKALANHKGSPDYTYQRPNRRQHGMPDAPLLKGVKKYQPNACVIVDTSGSMSSGCLAKALVVIRQGLQALGKVPVICCDARVTKDVVLTAFKDDFELIGGGGTDMRIPIAHAEKEHKPDCIVLVTDTETPWPEHPTKAQLIVAATRDGDVPKWATKVRIPDSPEKTRLD